MTCARGNGSYLPESYSPGEGVEEVLFVRYAKALTSTRTYAQLPQTILCAAVAVYAISTRITYFENKYSPLIIAFYAGLAAISALVSVGKLFSQVSTTYVVDDETYDRAPNKFMRYFIELFYVLANSVSCGALIYYLVADYGVSRSPQYMDFLNGTWENAHFYAMLAGSALIFLFDIIPATKKWEARGFAVHAIGITISFSFITAYLVAYSKAGIQTVHSSGASEKFMGSLLKTYNFNILLFAIYPLIILQIISFVYTTSKLFITNSTGMGKRRKLYLICITAFIMLACTAFAIYYINQWFQSEKDFNGIAVEAKKRKGLTGGSLLSTSTPFGDGILSSMTVGNSGRTRRPPTSLKPEPTAGPSIPTTQKVREEPKRSGFMDIFNRKKATTTPNPITTTTTTPNPVTTTTTQKPTTRTTPSSMGGEKAAQTPALSGHSGALSFGSDIPGFIVNGRPQSPYVQIQGNRYLETMAASLESTGNTLIDWVKRADCLNSNGIYSSNGFYYDSFKNIVYNREKSFFFNPQTREYIDTINEIDYRGGLGIIFVGSRSGELPRL